MMNAILNAGGLMISIRLPQMLASLDLNACTLVGMFDPDTAPLPLAVFADIEMLIMAQREAKSLLDDIGQN